MIEDVKTAGGFDLLYYENKPPEANREIDALAAFIKSHLCSEAENLRFRDAQVSVRRLKGIGPDETAAKLNEILDTVASRSGCDVGGDYYGGKFKIVTLNSQARCRANEYVVLELEDAALRQLSRRRPGILACMIEGVQPSESDAWVEKSGLDGVANRVFKSEDCSHVFCIEFYSEADMSRSRVSIAGFRRLSKSVLYRFVNLKNKFNLPANSFLYGRR